MLIQLLFQFIGKEGLIYLTNPNNLQWAAGMAFLAHITLVGYLMVTRHMSWECKGKESGECADGRLEGDHKYIIFGGSGAFSLGIVPCLYYTLIPWEGFLFLAQVQFFLSILDVSIFWVQLMKNWGLESVPVYSHGLLEGAEACLRMSLNDPIGLGAFVIQKLTRLEAIAQFRGWWQLQYDIAGMVMAIPLNVFFIPLGKMVVALPFTWK